MTGTTWPNYTAITNPVIAADTLLILDTLDDSANAAGTVHEISIPVLGQAFTRTVNAVRDYGADPTGGSDSTTAIQQALFSFGTATSWSQGAGGTVELGPGSFHISNTLIIPSGVTLKGAGPNATMITMLYTVAADVIQMETYDSAAQATILAATLGDAAPAQADLINAFFSGIEELGIHGGSFYQIIAGYNHGINVTTSPLDAAAPSDPGFDPSHHISNVYIQACTGDGYFHNGRSATTITNVWSESNNGNGFTPSFDTLMVNCNAGFNGVTGVYVDHGATNGASVKCYNNGCAPQWTTGQDWSAGNVVMYSGNLYFCILATSGSSTIPSSDATHWTELTGASSPQAWGYDFAFDSDASGESWTALDSQEPSAGSFWLNGCTGIDITGAATTTNFNNQSGAGQNDSNPDDYAAVYASDINGCNITVACSTLGDVTYALNVTGATRSNIILTTDGTEQGILAPGASLSGISAVINGLAHQGGGTDTSGTATASTPTFTSGTAKQLSTAQDVILYCVVTTAASQATSGLSIGSTSSASTAIVPSATHDLAVGSMWYVRVPAGWYVKFAGTPADWAFTQVTC